MKMLGIAIGVFAAALTLWAVAAGATPLASAPNATKLEQHSYKLAACYMTCRTVNCGNFDDGNGKCRQECYQHCY